MSERQRNRSKILYVIGTLDVGGTEGQLVQLVTHLNPKRFEPVVCCLSSSGPFARLLHEAGIPVEVIGFRGFHPFRYPHVWGVVSRLVRLIRFVRGERPLIVHSFLFWAYILGTYAAKLARVPVIIASRRGLGHFKEGKVHHLFLERIANRLTNVILANSEAVKADVVRQERVAPSMVRVIYNGIDPSLHENRTTSESRAALGIPDGGLVISVVARLFDYKGHEFFLRACCEISRRWPATTFLLIGDGPLRGRLEELARTFGLEQNVRFLGTRSDVPELLALTDVVVLPSLEEGFPNAVLEAMAAGKPVVATRVGGIPEAIVDEKTGLLVPAGDAASLAAAIGRLMEDPGRRTFMGAAGRQRVHERFGLSKMVAEMEALYEERLNVAGY